MVYFVGHVIKHKNNWIALSKIPVNIVNLNDDLSCRNLNPMSPSLHIIYQPSTNMIPLASSIIKTTYIKQFQKKVKIMIAIRREKMKFENIKKREIGLFFLNYHKNI